MTLYRTLERYERETNGIYLKIVQILIYVYTNDTDSYQSARETE